MLLENQTINQTNLVSHLCCFFESFVLVHFQLALHHHLYRMHAEKLYLKVKSKRAIIVKLVIKKGRQCIVWSSLRSRTTDLEPIQKDHIPCKYCAQSPAVASPALQTLSPSEPNSLCALGSRPQLNTLQTGQTGYSLKLHTYCRTSRVKVTRVIEIERLWSKHHSKNTIMIIMSVLVISVILAVPTVDLIELISYLHSLRNLSTYKSAYMHL